MNTSNRFPEVYRAFLDFVDQDVQRERSRSNRRLFSVFIWCFFMPAVVSVGFLLLVKFGIFPRKARAHLDWLILVFPVFYSLYVLGTEVLRGIPSIFKRGGLAASLRQAEEEGKWRERVCDSLSSLQFSETEWEWVLASFRVDVENIRHRTKYLTALAGAVFFLVMQGIDSLGDNSESIWLKNPIQGWAEATNDISQLLALGLFLVLLYLSGNQTYHSLLRYLNSSELALLKKRNRPSKS